LKRNRIELLEEINEHLKCLHEKIDILLETHKETKKEISHSTPEALDTASLLSIPDHLRKTLVTLNKLKEATAKDVALQTKRARALESGYLNQLVTMGFIKKERKSRKTYFIRAHFAI
jgi:DNA-directed RNA polymerase alpha subunit